MTEEWMPVPGWEGMYEVSNLGQVRSCDRLDGLGRRRKGRAIRPLWEGKPGRKYAVVVMQDAPRRERWSFGPLVLSAFVRPRAEGEVCRHLDGDSTNNSLGNLAWGTQSENMHDSIRHGTHPQTRKTHCPSGHPYAPENTYHAGDGRRICRTCSINQVTAYRNRKKGIAA